VVLLGWHLGTISSSCPGEEWKLLVRESFIENFFKLITVYFTAVWATVVHESMQPDGGVTLDQLNNYVLHPESTWTAICLLFRRVFHHRGAKRTRRVKYE
jgi:hypothetical protein